MLLKFYLSWLILDKKTIKLRRWVKPNMTRYQLYLYHWSGYTGNSKPQYHDLRGITQLLYMSSTNNESQVEPLSSYNFWSFLYRQQYLTSLFRLPVQFRNINIQEVVPTDLVLYMVHSAKSVRWKKYSIMHGNEVIELLFLCLWVKNLRLFMEWMRKYFENANLKKHRRLFSLLNVIIGRLMWNHNLFLQLKGMRITLRGKFGKAGSVRKTRKYIRRGKCSYATKKIAIISQTIVIRTLTGVFSIRFEVFF